MTVEVPTPGKSPERGDSGRAMAKIKNTLRDRLEDVAHLVRVIRTGSRYPELNELARSIHQQAAFGEIDHQLEEGQITPDQAEQKKHDWLKRHR